jgi:hypothetical protein
MNVSARPALTVGDAGTAADPDLVAAINMLYTLGITDGKTQDLATGTFTFDGEEDVTREEFATFLARIASRDPAMLRTPLRPQFDDWYLISDWAQASIVYCVGEQIVNGVGEYEGADGKIYPNGFNPKATITLQQAITMMMRALGYNTLIYPFGPMQESTNEDVGLRGPHNAPNFTTTGFDFDGVSGSATLTRNDMAMLLWNFLGSNYMERTLENLGGNWISVVKTTPVLEKWPAAIAEAIAEEFGTEGLRKALEVFVEADTVIGYVVGTPEWAIDIDVREYIGGYDVNITAASDVRLTLVGKFANPDDRRNRHDLVIGFGEPVMTGTGPNLRLNYYDDEYLETLRSEIGFAAGEDLLGRKVSFKMIDGELVPGSGEIIGTKEGVVPSTTRAGVDRDGGKVNKVNSLTLANVYTSVGAGADKEFDQNFNLYMFGNTRLAEIANTDASLWQLGEFAHNAANFKLTYVWNGEDSDGFDEFFYIFEPFSVGFFNKIGTGDDAGRVSMRTDYSNNDDAWVGNTKTDDVVVLALNKDDKEEEFAVGNAYLYTVRDKTLFIHEKLTPQASAAVNTRVGGAIRFNIPDPEDATKTVILPRTIDWRATGSRAIGAKDAANDIDLARFSTLFMDASGAVLLAREGALITAAAPDFSNYGVVVDKDVITLHEGTSLVTYNRVQLWDVSAEEYRWVRTARNVGTTEKGEHAADPGELVRIGSTGDHQIVTLLIFTDEGFINGGSGGNEYAASYATVDDLYSTGTILTLGGGGLTERTTPSPGKARY